MSTMLNFPRFGALAIQDEQILRTASPILGFEHLQRYVIIEVQSHHPFVWLQSIEELELAFLLADPGVFALHYNKEQLARHAGRNIDKLEILLMVILSANREEAPRPHTLGPLWFDPEEKVFGQWVIDGRKADSIVSSTNESAPCPMGDKMPHVTL